MLATLPEVASESLAAAVRKYVHRKYVLDKLCAEHDLNGMVDGTLRGGYSAPAEAHSFFIRTMPFASRRGVTSFPEPFLVPVANTLGCSWRWRPSSIKPEEKQALVDKLLEPDRAAPQGKHAADYHLITPLGLVLPHEGKNRVDFLRSEGVSHVPARVTVSDYPAPAQIVLYKVVIRNKSRMLAVLDQNWIQFVDHEEWAEPLLHAYGVTTEHGWPEHLPRLQHVVDALDQQENGNELVWPADSPFPNVPTVSVLDIQKKQVSATEKALRESELLNVGVSEIDAVKPRWDILAVLAVVFLFAIAGMAHLPQEWIQLRQAAAYAMAAIVGIFAAMTLRLWRVPRKLLVHRLQ